MIVRTRLLLIVSLIAACGGSEATSPPPDAKQHAKPHTKQHATGEESLTVPVAAVKPQAVVSECIIDAAEQAACKAQGEHFRYGKRPGTESCAGLGDLLHAGGLSKKKTKEEPNDAPLFPCVCMMNEACVFDRSAAARCGEKGPNFFYGPWVDIRCQGTAPRPGEMQCQRERARASACSCNDRAAIAKRRERCSMIP